MNVLTLAEAARTEPPYVRQTTWKNWMKAIKPIADTDVSQIDKYFAKRYVFEQSQKLSQGTVRARVGTLSGIWNRAIEQELVAVNPWFKSGKKLKASRKHHEFREWDFYERYHNDPLFLLLWYHGFRVGEIAGIQKQDVKWDAKIPYFNLVHYKNGRQLKNDASIRQVPIHPACQSFVRDLKYPLSRDINGPGRSWSETFKANLGLPNGESAHSLRHNFTSRLRALHPNPAVEARLLGHTFPNMTARYGTVLLSSLAEVLWQMPVYQKLR
jgi:integrase